jgi:glycogen synthase
LNGMAKDFSWNTSAAEYAKLYEAARAARNLNAVPTSN